MADAAAAADMLTAAQGDDAAAVRELLRRGCPPTVWDGLGRSALHLGAGAGAVGAVSALLEARAEPNAQHRLRGSTPLHAALAGPGALERRTDCLRLLVECRGDPARPYFTGELRPDFSGDEVGLLALGSPPMPLHQAVGSLQVDALATALQGLQDVGDLDLDAPNSGETALHLAVALDWHEGAKRLLAARASPCLQSAWRRAPLHTAVLRGSLGNVQALLEARAEVDARDLDPQHDPPYYEGSFESAPYEHRTPLHYAAELGSTAVLRALLGARADIDARDAARQTPLLVCLEAQSGDDQDRTLDVGSGVRVVGASQWEGRAGAVIAPTSSCARASEGDAGQFDGTRHVRLFDGSTQEEVMLQVEHLKALHGECLDLLLEARADMSIEGGKCSVLHEAARCGDGPLAAKVLAAGAAVNQVDSKLGLSALHAAARGKHGELVGLLLAARADASAVTAGGKTAADLAETNGADAATVALLRGGQPGPGAAQAPTAVAGARGGSGAAGGVEGLTPAERRELFLE